MWRCRPHVVMLFGTMKYAWALLLLTICCLSPKHATSTLLLYPPRILLPYNYGIPSNITISVIGGVHCSFEWKSTNPNIVVVDPICESEDCCREAIVSVVSSSSSRISTRVIAVAKGHSENQILQCEVITDNPTSIELTKPDEIYLNGVPAVLSVVAKDKFENVFDSINGLIFQWSAKSEGNPLDTQATHGNDNLEPESLLEALPSFPKCNSELERRSMLGHTVVFTPKKLGRYSIRAHLNRRNLIDLEATDTVFVKFPVKILPSSSIDLIKFANVDIAVESYNGNKIDILSYERRLVNSDSNSKAASSNGLAYRENGVLKVTGIQFAEMVEIAVPNSLENFPRSSSNDYTLYASIEVKRPVKLGFRISKGDFSTLEEMQIYVVTVEIFGEDNLVIYPSDNIRITTTFPSSLFYVNSTTSNGTFHVVQALVPGKGTIKAEYKGVLTSDSSSVKNFDEASATLEVTVCQKLEISPKFLLLPTASDSVQLQEIRLMASGGTGNYKWTTDTSKEIALINFDDAISHVAYLKIFNESDFNVILSDSNNLNFIAKSQVSVQNVLDIEVYPSVVESQIGNVIILPVAFLAYEDKEKKIVRKFDDCSMLKPTVEIIEKHLISLDEEPHVPAFGKGCTNLQFKCKAPGYSRVNIYYESRVGHDVVKHKTTTVLACFKPLKPVHPVRVAVLPIGGTKEIAFEGGPRKWPLYKDGHFAKLVASKPEIIDVQIIKDPIRYNRDLTVFRVVCKELGENTLTFKIGNEASATNPHPAKEETTIKFICSEPHTIHLKLVQKKKNNLLEDNIVKVPFYGEKLFSVDVWIKDEMGRKLSNISSLHVEFENLDKNLIEDTNFKGLQFYENAVAGYRKISRDYAEFKMTGNTGDLQLTAKVKSYKPEVLEQLEISEPEHVFKEISASIDLKFVSLRDISAGLYMKEEGSNGAQSEEGTCDEESCTS
ncbi:hypothetical protein JTE90_016014 [Oedothorax gibbosus]|uniref:Uncharacterized protein n=1 Tax=Oedothorax gibbosus TaxID=931172 RepID=A0AAV6VRE5_9ARAC|nr:hypothetical protein JTE90_016014 [Oedothorax gibbosus]